MLDVVDVEESDTISSSKNDRGNTLEDNKSGRDTIVREISQSKAEGKLTTAEITKTSDNKSRGSQVKNKSDRGIEVEENNLFKDDGILIAISKRSCQANIEALDTPNRDAPLYIFDVEETEVVEVELNSKVISIAESKEEDNEAFAKNGSKIMVDDKQINLNEQIEALLPRVDNGGIVIDGDRNISIEKTEIVLRDRSNTNSILDDKMNTSSNDKNDVMIPSIRNDNDYFQGNELQVAREYLNNDIKEQNFANNSTINNAPKFSTVNFKEGLTPWLPPSITHAVEFKQRSIFREGTSSLWETNITKASDLSRGVLLYFEFAKSASFCMLLLSIFSIPSIIFARSGKRIPIANRDVIGFSQFTIGNIGYDRSSLTYLSDSTCKNQPSSYKGTCITIFGSEMKFVDVETVLTTFEFLQIVVYLLFILRLFWKSLVFSRREGDQFLYQKYYENA